MLAGLLICSAFFSACEAAFFSLNSLQLKELQENSGHRGLLVKTLLDKPRKLLITIYIGNELVNIAVSVIATSISIKIFGSLGVGIAIGAGTFLLLVFGEIIPKSMSLKFAQTYALFAAYPLNLFAKIVQPAQRVLTRIAEKLISILGIKPVSSDQHTITDEEFKSMVRMSEGEGVLDAEESELIHNVIHFGETTVADIMVPQIDMFSVRIDDTLDTVLPKIIENFYSRVPVYDKEEESIVGILFTKDLNRFKNMPRENFHLNSIIRPVFSVPQTKKIKELLQEFRKMKRHMAVVLDEYGSVCGLVTLEDILEELVGEIDSEMRTEETAIHKIGEHLYRVSATLSLSEFNEHFNSELPEETYDTVGGLVFGLFGRVPRSGEAITNGNLKFRIEKMKGPRILKLHLTVIENKDGSGESDREDVS